jgi:hypothetical protein
VQVSYFDVVERCTKPLSGQNGRDRPILRAPA